MKLPFLTRTRDVTVEPIAMRDARWLETLHREDFARPWSALEFAGLIEQESVFGFVAREVGRPGDGPAGFVLARQAAGEGEILTLAVARARRREGLGRRLMDAVLRVLHSERADALFLEVEEGNEAALALYRRLGFAEVGRRPRYYARSGGPSVGAIVMRRDLR